MKKARVAALALASAMLLFGCADRNSTSTFTPQQNSIFVTRDGQISSALVEADPRGDYDVEKLKAFIQTNITEYNAEKGSDNVTLASCTLGNGKGIAVFDYASGADLYDFTSKMEDTANQAADLTLSTVSEGLVAGKVSDGNWVRAKDGSSVSVDTVTKQGEMKLISLDGAVIIQTEGAIQYYSDNITLRDRFTAVVSGGKAYIVFK